MSADDIFGARVNGCLKETVLGDIIPIDKTKLTEFGKLAGMKKKRPKRTVDELAESIYINEINELLDPPGDLKLYSELDIELVQKIRDELVDGNYHVPAEKVAKAIVDEALWLERCLV